MQLTVCAPTNAAFAELGLTAENIDTTLTKEQLQGILLYHVTPGRRVSPSVVNAPRQDAERRLHHHLAHR